MPDTGDTLSRMRRTAVGSPRSESPRIADHRHRGHRVASRAGGHRRDRHHPTMGATASAAAVPGTSVQLVAPTSDPACVPPADVPSSARQVVRVDASGTYATVDLLQQLDGTWQCTRRGMTEQVSKARRPAARPAGQRRRHHAGGHVPARHDDGPGQPDVPVLRQRVQPGRAGASGARCSRATAGTRPVAGRRTTRSPTAARRSARATTEVPRVVRRRLLAGGAHRGEHGPGSLRRPGRRGAARPGSSCTRFSYSANGNSKPTSGCVSLAGDDLDAVLRALVPGQAWFVITA